MAKLLPRGSMFMTVQETEGDRLKLQAHLERQVRHFMSRNGKGRQKDNKIVKQFIQQGGQGSKREVLAAVRNIRRGDRLDSKARIKAEHSVPFPDIRRNLNYFARLTQCQQGGR